MNLFRTLREFFTQGSDLSHEHGPSKDATFEDEPVIPASAQDAHERLYDVLAQRDAIDELSHAEFMRGWIAMAYIAPGLNPDEALNKDGGWPVGWQPVAAEAFRRFTTKELTKEELYPEANSR